MEPPSSISTIPPRPFPRRDILPRQPGYPPGLPTLPDCGNVCVTNRSTLDSQRPGGCGFSDTICHCGSAAYMQPMYDCFAATCNHTDLVASYVFVDAICASVGAAIVSGLSTQDPRTTSTPSPNTSSPSSSSPSSSPSITPPGNVSTTPTTSRTGTSPTLSGVPSPVYSFSTPTESSNVSDSPNGPLVGQTMSPPPNTGAIVGGSVAGIAVLGLLLFGLWLLRRRKRLKESPTPLELTDQSSIAGLTADSGRGFYPSTKHPRNLNLVSDQPYLIPVSGVDDGEERRRRPASTVMTESTEPPPPAYQPSPDDLRLTRGGRAGIVLSDTQDPLTSIRESLDDTPEARIYATAINQFCTANRDIISPTLESKLRAAHWLPTDDPSEIPAEYWHKTYGVEFFELKRIQEAYSRGRTAADST